MRLLAVVADHPVRDPGVGEERGDRAAHAGAGHVRVDTVDPTAIPAPADVTVELPGCADALVGVVRDASGGVIAGAEVTRARGAWGDVTALGLGVLTDATGAYELCTPPGPITAVVRADGYGAMTVLDTVLGRRQRDVELMPAATLVGRVVRAGSSIERSTLEKAWTA